jgi:hypothetical protein
MHCILKNTTAKVMFLVAIAAHVHTVYSAGDIQRVAQEGQHLNVQGINESGVSFLELAIDINEDGVLDGRDTYLLSKTCESNFNIDFPIRGNLSGKNFKITLWQRCYNARISKDVNDDYVGHRTPCNIVIEGLARVRSYTVRDEHEMAFVIGALKYDSYEIWLEKDSKKKNRLK